jgi:hypothetical protein
MIIALSTGQCLEWITGQWISVTCPVTLSAGADGKTILYGTAAPTTEGVDGDFYIRTTTNYIYGPKAGGTWPSGTSLVGPAIGSAGGSLVGTYPNPDIDFPGVAVLPPTTTGIVRTVRLTPGNTLWRGDGLTWSQVGGGGIGGSGGVLTVTYADATDLTIGSSCSVATPCKVRVGTTVFSLQGAATVTISAGTGTAWIWIDAAGAINVGHNLTATCVGATCSAATGFPVSGVFPVWTWTALSGAWNPSGGTDWTTTYAIDTPELPGLGITVASISGSRTIGIDTTVVPVPATAPADGQMMRFSASAGQWQTVTVRYTASFTSQTSVVVPGATHNLGTADLTVTCYSADTPPVIMEPDGWITDPASFDTTIKFPIPESGRCVLR